MLAGRDLRFWHFSMLGHQLHAAALGAAGDDTRLSDAHRRLEPALKGRLEPLVDTEARRAARDADENAGVRQPPHAGESVNGTCVMTVVGGA